MPDGEKLKPCPFCGNENPVYWCYPEDGRTLFTDRWAVLCYYPDGGCGAEGSHQKSKAEAAAAWNERKMEIVRCKECIHRGNKHKCILAFISDKQDFPFFFYDNHGEWFCSDGKRR